MNKELQIFNNPEFGVVKAVIKDREPLFLANPLAEGLNYSETSKMLKRLDEDEKMEIKSDEVATVLGLTFEDLGLSKFSPKAVFITESGLYNAILGSDKPEAKKFKKWVTKEVLPAIRKTGGYIPHDEDDSDEEILAKALLVANRTIDKKNNKIKALEKETLKLVDVIENQKPKLDYLDQILSCEDALLMTSIAFDYGLSAQALNKILCEERVQRNVRGQWILYSDYLGKGYTKTETKVFGDKPRVQTLWTQKGRMLIHEILNKRNIKALIDTELAEA